MSMVDDNAVIYDPHGICTRCGHWPHRGAACGESIKLPGRPTRRCSCVRRLGPTCAVCGVEARLLVSEDDANGSTRMVCPEPIPCLNRRFALMARIESPESEKEKNDG